MLERPKLLGLVSQLGIEIVDLDTEFRKLNYPIVKNYTKIGENFGHFSRIGHELVSQVLVNKASMRTEAAYRSKLTGEAL